MFVFTLLISRLVPAALGLSLFLILGRFGYDWFAPRSRVLARVLFASVLGLGGLILLPYLLRTGVLLGAELAFEKDKWPDANGRFVLYRRLGGRTSETLNLDWASSLINMRRWREAETVLVSGVRRTPRGVDAYPRTILLLGMCRYFQGRFDESEKAFRAVCSGSNETVCHYFLARMADRRGDASGAIEGYRRSLRQTPQFFPAVYHSIRLLLASGDRSGARAVFQQFVGTGGVGDAPETASLGRAIEAGGGELPDREFFLIQN
ncbi:MAG TPA: tetratricopeptide repeat protein [Thermoanaerobaculia bacterium]|nr:tetratricopeptide repeat protein [Thermoanaerobaculia bacterium]